MEYSKLISVTGISGVFEVVSSKQDGAIVRSLETKVTTFISSRIHNISQIEKIEVYTIEDNVNLIEIFKAMDSCKDTLPEVKDEKAVRAYFEKVYPNMDNERVYASDRRKMIKWYQILKANKIDFKLSEEEATAE